MKQLNLILASTSPRRKALLEQIDIPFSSVPPRNADETLDATKNHVHSIEQLALEKAQSLREDYDDHIILGADTLVKVNGHVLGKPVDGDDAKRMLRELSGKTHQVITGVAIVTPTATQMFHSITDVVFHAITDEEIDEYIASQEVFNKAGAYAIQGFGARYVKSISGDYYTVMGLPLNKVYRALMSILSEN